jgi:GTPase SAR1 family protein
MNQECDDGVLNTRWIVMGPQCVGKTSLISNFGFDIKQNVNRVMDLQERSESKELEKAATEEIHIYDRGFSLVDTPGLSSDDEMTVTSKILMSLSDYTYDGLILILQLENNFRNLKRYCNVINTLRKVSNLNGTCLTKHTNFNVILVFHKRDEDNPNTGVYFDKVKDFLPGFYLHKSIYEQGRTIRLAVECSLCRFKVNASSYLVKKLEELMVKLDKLGSFEYLATFTSRLIIFSNEFKKWAMIPLSLREFQAMTSEYNKRGYIQFFSLYKSYCDKPYTKIQKMKSKVIPEITFKAVDDFVQSCNYVNNMRKEIIAECDSIEIGIVDIKMHYKDWSTHEDLCNLLLMEVQKLNVFLN